MICAMSFDKYELGKMLYNAAVSRGYLPKDASVCVVEIADPKNEFRISVRNTEHVQIRLSIELPDDAFSLDWKEVQDIEKHAD